MHDKLIAFNKAQRTKNVPEIRSGDVVRVHRKIKEGEKERVQVFEGMVIATRGGQSSSETITVRKVSNGVGVEIVVPIHAPFVEKIELVKRARTRRSKLYFIRHKAAKALRFKFKDMAAFAQPEAPVEEKKGETTDNVEDAPAAEEKTDAPKAEAKEEVKEEAPKAEKKDDAAEEKK